MADGGAASTPVRMLDSTTAAETVVFRTYHNEKERVSVRLSSTVSELLLASNIPSFLSVRDFLGQVGDELIGEVLRMHVVSVASPNVYGALILMASKQGSQALRKGLDMKPISALAKETLVFAFVDLSSFCWWHGCPCSVPLPLRSNRSSTPDFQRSSSSSPTLAHSPPQQPAQECTICLEPLGDSPTLCTLCGHAFHVGCFMKVEDDACPLCRFDITEATRATCELCRAASDLWMCLLCGRVFCGRNSDGHAQRHFASTGHTYTVQVGGFRVWDYRRDSFIHRLILASNEDQSVKVVQPPRWADEDDDDLERAVFASQTEAVADFYSRLLSDQLKAQCEYYAKCLEAEARRGEQLPLLVEEKAARKLLVDEYVRSFTAMAATSRVMMLAQTQQLTRRRSKILEDIKLFATTTKSLLDGAQHCKNLLSRTVESNSQATNGASMARVQELEAPTCETLLSV